MLRPVTGDCYSSASGVITEPDLQQLILDRLEAWGDLWEITDLARKVRVRVSQRMRCSLGRWVPACGEIRLSILALTTAPLLDEVFCHEAAHAAVQMLHGRGCRPHGTEWQALIRAAGFEPRTHIPVAAEQVTVRRTRSARVYEHRCPVCQSIYRARRPIHRMRCTSCVVVGLEGSLEILRREENRW